MTAARRRSWPLMQAVLALAAFAAAACGSGAEGGGQTVPPTIVEAVVAERDTIQASLRSVGSLEADAQVQVRAEADGRVSRILFREGDTVRQGTRLLLLEQDRLRAEVEAADAARARASAEAENLGRQVERNRALLESGAISPQAFDDLETRHETAVAMLEEVRAGLSVARERLAEATVLAPFSGRIGERVVDLGDFVSRSDPLFTLVDDDSLEIAFSVPERYVGRLEPGSPVQLTVQSYPDRRFEGSVTFVSPVVDPTNRTVRLKARVPNPGGALRAGQFANVLLGLERRPDAVIVPEAAVVPRGGQTFVFQVSQGVANLRQVEVGERSRGIVEMASGVRPGDTIVVAGQQKLRDGSPVAPEVRPLRLELEPPGTGSAGDEAAADDGGGGRVPSGADRPSAADSTSGARDTSGAADASGAGAGG